MEISFLNILILYYVDGDIEVIKASIFKLFNLTIVLIKYYIIAK